MDERLKSIGIFDSGIGGLTVMREIKKLLPHEDLIYFGDTARVPYGNKSAETIIRYSLESAAFLVKQKIKLLIVACNTASAWALPTLQEHFPIPIIGVILPSIEKLIKATHTYKVGILGTRATIASKMHVRLLKEKAPHLEIFPIATPLFVPLVEEGFFEHSISQHVADEYLAKLHDKGIDAALLACTHYPLLEGVIQKVLGNNVKLINPAIACAEEAVLLLNEKELLSPKKSPNYKFFVSDNLEHFKSLSTQLLGNSIDKLALAIP